MPQLVKNIVEKRFARCLKTRPQVRKTFPPEAELRSLARSVMKRQIHPFIILPDDFILDGECRWRGLMLENPEFEVDVIVVDRELAPGETGELQLISALHSTSLTPFDQSVACKEWMEHNPNATVKELAEKIDRDPSMLTRLNALWKTNPAVVKAAEEGKIGPKAWYQISLLPAEEHSALLEMYLSGMSSGQITDLIRQKRQDALAGHTAETREDLVKQAAEEKRSTTLTGKVNKVKCVLTSGFQVTVTGDGVSLETSIDALNETIKEMKRARELGYTAKTFAAAMRDKAKKG